MRLITLFATNKTMDHIAKKKVHPVTAISVLQPQCCIGILGLGNGCWQPITGRWAESKPP